MSDISDLVAAVIDAANKLGDTALKSQEKVSQYAVQIKTLQAQVAAIPKIDAKEIEALKAKAAKYDQFKALLGE